MVKVRIPSRLRKDGCIWLMFGDVLIMLLVVQLIEIARDLPVLYACKLHGIGKYPVASLFPVKFPCY